MIVPQDFYTGSDVVSIARDLLGKKLVTDVGGRRTSGFITETEAYSGRGDRACHANNNTCTKRTAIMYAYGGVAYVYLCYGIHQLFNVVTNTEGLADAVLVRGIAPVEGIVIMEERRNMKYSANLTNGPGKLSQALGIGAVHYGVCLYDTNSDIRIEEGKQIDDRKVFTAPRIGVGYAGEDALLPWRFYLK